VEQVVLLREYWKKHPEDRVKIKQYAAAKRFYCAPGMYTMPDSNIPSGENFIRNALLGRNWLKKNLGITPNCCWMADIFGHNPQSPQLAKTCGFESYMFERGKAGSWNTTFNWKGIDGTMLAAHWEVDTYYGVVLGMAWEGSRPQEWIDRRIVEQVLGPQQEGSPCKDVLMTPLGGDFLKPLEKHWKFVHEWNRRSKDYHLKFSHPEDYFVELKKRGVSLPVEKNDLNPLCEGCFSSRIRIKQYNRRLEETAASLEVLESLNGSGHKGSEAVWEAVAFNAFHDIICGSLVRKAAEEALEKYRKTEEFAESKIKALMLSIVNTNRGSENPRSVKEGMHRDYYDSIGNQTKASPIAGNLFFNSLPFPRKEIVQFSGDGKTHVFKEVKLLPLGFAFVSSSDKNAVRNGVMISHSGKCLENEKIKTVFGQNGTIVSLYDKESEKELALADSGMNNPMMGADIGDPWTINGAINSSLLRTAPFHNPKLISGVKVCREGRVDTRCADADCYDWPKPEIIFADPLQATIQFSYPKMNLRTQITLRKGEKLLRIKTFFMPTGKKYRLQAAFPTTIKNGKIRHSVPCGHIERPEGEYGVQGWIDYADKEKGVLLLNKGLPGNNVTDGVMLLSLFRAVSMERNDKYPWYEEGIEHVFDYGIMPFSPADKTYNPTRAAALFNREVCMFPVSGVSKELLNRSPLLELKGDGAELTCLRREKDGLLLRLWESRGENSKVKCILADTIRSCFKMDAAGIEKMSQEFHGNIIEMKLKPFEITTLFVK
jgi:alpha-mannosidase